MFAAVQRLAEFGGSISGCYLLKSKYLYGIIASLFAKDEYFAYTKLSFCLSYYNETDYNANFVRLFILFCKMLYTANDMLILYAET